MSNINFDNPWLLFVGVPLLAVIIVPFVISVRKENRNKHNVISLVCHLVIALLVTLVFAGMRYEKVTTQTNVYVLADVSYSSHNNLEVLDGCIDKVEESLPNNSKMSVIAFGRNCQMLNDFDEPRVSVKNANKVDTSGTDIANALRYANNMFDDNVIKRIVVITDGQQTAGGAKLKSVVNALQNDGVYVDTVFLDNTLAEDVKEIQISSVNYTSNSFVGKAEKAELLINCNNASATNVYIDVERNGVKSSITSVLYKGQNTVAVPLDTSGKATNNYKISVRPVVATDDTSPYNNSCVFVQNVKEEVQVLFVGGSYMDLVTGQRIYGTENVTFVYRADDVPYTAEDLCVYDEIALCNFDVRKMLNAEQFVANLDAMVSKFGKTLTTYGNTYVQELSVEDNSALTALDGMLPVVVGNPDQNERMVTFVLDISTSMNFVDRLAVARGAASTLLDNLTEKDMVLVVGYSGDLTMLFPAAKLVDKQAVLDIIDEYTPRNGTVLSKALEVAKDIIATKNYHQKELIIISDGLHSDDDASCQLMAETISANNVVISALGIFPPDNGNSRLQKMVYNKNANGKGYYKAIRSESEVDYTIQSIAQDLQEVKIEGSSYEVEIKRFQEKIVDGVDTIAPVKGFWYSSAKSSSTTVLTAKWNRDRLTSFDVPIYAYWSYGNGKVVSVLTDLSNSSNWASNWHGTNENTLIGNIKGATLPSERVETPFLIQSETDGNVTHVSVTAASFRATAVLSVDLVNPDGTVVSKPLSFDSEKYVADFETEQIGLYTIRMTYDYSNLHYQTESTFSIDYSPEYNSYAPFAVASMYRIITDNGEVSLDGNLKMDNSDSATQTYTLSFTVPFMIACVSLFVVDIIIRKLRWKDIKSVFVRKSKRGGKDA